LLVPGGLALSDYEKAEARADSLEAQFQPVYDPSPTAVIEMFNEAMRAYEYAPASEPKLTIPSEVQKAIKGLKFLQGYGPERHPEQGVETSPQKNHNVPHDIV
jgi:hypothetical protein